MAVSLCFFSLLLFYFFCFLFVFYSCIYGSLGLFFSFCFFCCFLFPTSVSLTTLSFLPPFPSRPSLFSTTFSLLPLRSHSCPRALHASCCRLVFCTSCLTSTSSSGRSPPLFSFQPRLASYSFSFTSTPPPPRLLRITASPLGRPHPLSSIAVLITSLCFAPAS